MLKGPEIYNPIDNIKNATNRRNTVLANMVDDKKLSQADADSAAGVDMLVAWMIPIKGLAMTTSIRLTLMPSLKKLRNLWLE